MTTSQSEKPRDSGEVKQDSPYLEPQAPPTGGAKAPAAARGAGQQHFFGDSTGQIFA